MSLMPIDPSFAVGGPEWSIAPIAPAQPAGASGTGFAGMLGDQLQQLSVTQAEAASQSRLLATGEAQDPAEVVMAVEKAQLEMQMATTMRNKGVEVIQELMRTQV